MSFHKGDRVRGKATGRVGIVTDEPIDFVMVRFDGSKLTESVRASQLEKLPQEATAEMTLIRLRDIKPGMVIQRVTKNQRGGELIHVTHTRRDDGDNFQYKGRYLSTGELTDWRLDMLSPNVQYLLHENRPVWHMMEIASSDGLEWTAYNFDTAGARDASALRELRHGSTIRYPR